MLQFRRSKVKDFLAVAMIFFLLMGQIVGGLPFRPAMAAGDDPVLVITGTGLEQDIFLYEEDLAFDNPTMEERYYSSNNSFNFRSIWKVKGFDLFDLLEEATSRRATGRSNLWLRTALTSLLPSASCRIAITILI